MQSAQDVLEVTFKALDRIIEEKDVAAEKSVTSAVRKKHERSKNEHVPKKPEGNTSENNR
ncbi:MAG: hypothetical protein V2I35_07110 [Desulfocapsaceae bacterium]|nr:hypothetical protein [Desulfocapsaceae bacterium]